jgi:hypothetical protein
VHLANVLIAMKRHEARLRAAICALGIGEIPSFKVKLMMSSFDMARASLSPCMMKSETTDLVLAAQALRKADPT